MALRNGGRSRIIHNTESTMYGNHNRKHGFSPWRFRTIGDSTISHVRGLFSKHASLFNQHTMVRAVPYFINKRYESKGQPTRSQYVEGAIAMLQYPPKRPTSQPEEQRWQLASRSISTLSTGGISRSILYREECESEEHSGSNCHAPRTSTGAIVTFPVPHWRTSNIRSAPNLSTLQHPSSQPEQHRQLARGRGGPRDVYSEGATLGSRHGSQRRGSNSPSAGSHNPFFHPRQEASQPEGGTAPAVSL